MRQGQQNRRGRGRNNRSKGQNPLTRSFESSGPDVKIRGTPAHIAEKYISYARDALSSGDPVLAENYLQHAEHYNRIIMAYREQNAQMPGDGMNGNGHRMQPGSGEFQDYPGGDGDDDYYDSGDPFRPQQRGFQQQHESEPQPRMDGDQGGARRYPQGQQQQHQQHQRNRPHRQRPDRHHDRGMERGQDRQDRTQERVERVERVERADRPAERMPERGGEQRRPPAPQQFTSPPEEAAPVNGREAAGPRLGHDEQPEFLRRPVRRPRREQPAPDQDQPAGSLGGKGDTAEEAVD